YIRFPTRIIVVGKIPNACIVQRCVDHYALVFIAHKPCCSLQPVLRRSRNFLIQYNLLYWIESRFQEPAENPLGALFHRNSIDDIGSRQGLVDSIEPGEKLGETRHECNSLNRHRLERDQIAHVEGPQQLNLLRRFKLVGKTEKFSIWPSTQCIDLLHVVETIDDTRVREKVLKR